MQVQRMITQERLFEVLYYNKNSGVFVWNISPNNSTYAGTEAGNIDAYGYLVTSIDNKRYKLHRLAWLYEYGEMPKNQIDHINGIKTDNRIENLRDVNGFVNQQNRRVIQKNNNSGYTGVCFVKNRNKWMAQIKVENKFKYLGLYETAELANEAYIKAKREFHNGCTI